MKACEDWLNRMYIPYQPKENTIAAQINEARREGWKAALEWVLTQKIQSTEEVLIGEDAIRKELEDK